MKKVISPFFISILMSCALSSTAQWERVFGISGGNISCVADSGSTVYAVTFQEGVFISEDDGNNWAEINNGFGTDSVILSLTIRGATVYAGTSTGNVYFSNNNGANWNKISNGLVKDGIIALAINDSDIFAGTLANGVYISSNGGASWTLANNGLTDTIISSLVINGSNIFATTYGGGVFLSSDNARSWSAINNGLTDSIVYSLAANGTNIFAGTLNNGVFFSSNNGSAWTKVDSGLPATNILSVATVGSNILAGTSNAGIFLSTNNGSTWSAFNDGLTGYTLCFFNSFAINDSYIFAGTQSTENGIWRRSLSDITAVENIYKNNSISIYPNPASDKLFINGYSFSGRSNLKIYNFLGQVCYQAVISNPKSEIDISTLASGLYLLEIADEKGKWVGKFAKE